MRSGNFSKKNSHLYLIESGNLRGNCWVEEEIGYTKLIYLKYTSKMCEVYFPKVFFKITIGVCIFTNAYIRRLKIVHIFTITKHIIEIVFKSTILLGHYFRTPGFEIVYKQYNLIEIVKKFTII